MIDVFVGVHNLENLRQKRQVIESWRKMADGEMPQVRLRVMVPATSDLVEKADKVVENLGIKKEMLMIIGTGGGPEGESTDHLMAFQRLRRIIAEKLADTEVYVVADDDCLPIGSSFVDLGLKAMEKHPDFGVLSAMPVNANIVAWTGESHEHEVKHSDMVMEQVDTGGIRFIRKGVMSGDVEDWREQKDNNEGGRGWKYDRDHAEQMRERGMRVGYVRAMKMKHLGERKEVASE